MRISDWSSDVCSSDLQLASAAAELSNEQPERSAKAMGNSSRNIIEISFPEFEFVRTIVEDCSPSFQSGVAFLGSSWKIGAKGRSSRFFRGILMSNVLIGIIGVILFIGLALAGALLDRKSTRLNSSH